MKHQLDFEKPILELQRKLEELKRHPENNSMGISFTEEVAIIEKKIEETKRQIFAQLSPWAGSKSPATPSALSRSITSRPFLRISPSYTATASTPMTRP